MIKLLVYIAIALTLVLIFQLMRIYQLSSELKGKHVGLASEKDNRSQANKMLLFMVGFFVFFIWLIFRYERYTFQAFPPASDIAQTAHNVFAFNWVIIFIVFFCTEGMLFYFAYKYKKTQKNPKAFFYPHNDKLELLWTVVPSIALAIIIIYGLSLWGRITGTPDKDAIVMQVYAKQFDYTIRYAGADNVLGKSDYRLIDDATNPLGMDTNDPHGKDDIIVKSMFHIPVNTPIVFKCNSRDVMHGVYLPYQSEQINTVPGMTTELHFTPTVTTEEMRKMTHDTAFNFVIFCNRVCGAGHYNMHINFVVDTKEDYQKWLAKQKPFLQNESTATAMK